jgi:hypothetical protein
MTSGDNLLALWSGNESTALAAAQTIYAVSLIPIVTRDRLSNLLLRFATSSDIPQDLESAAAEYTAKVAAHLFKGPPSRFAEIDISSAFSVQERFTGEIWCRSIIAGYHALQRGDWVVPLSIAQKRNILSTLSGAIRSLPPLELRIFWHALDTEVPDKSSNLAEGLRALLWGHKVDHLIVGLQLCSSTQVMHSLLLAVEQLADPRALPLLHQLEPVLAVDNWPLARLVGRAINVIYQQNPGIIRSDLLLPSRAPQGDTLLVRTANRGTIQSCEHNPPVAIIDTEARQDLSAKPDTSKL